MYSAVERWGHAELFRRPRLKIYSLLIPAAWLGPYALPVAMYPKALPEGGDDPPVRSRIQSTPTGAGVCASGAAHCRSLPGSDGRGGSCRGRNRHRVEFPAQHDSAARARARDSDMEIDSGVTS